MFVEKEENAFLKEKILGTRKKYDYISGIKNIFKHIINN